MSGGDDERAGVSFTHLDQELFDGSGATKRNLIDYLDAVSARILPCLDDRPLSVIRIRPGQPAFMQKNLPKYTRIGCPERRSGPRASRREVSYALCNDRRTLLWFANQRAVEYHVTLFTMSNPGHPDYLVLDLDPPEGSAFSTVVQAAHLIHQALTDAGMAGAVKTSGAKGLHVFVPLAAGSSPEDVAAATRAVAARAERIDPDLATTAFRQGRASRQGLSRLDPRWWRHRRGGVQPTYPARRACVASLLPGKTSIGWLPAISQCITRAASWMEAIRGRIRCRQPKSWTRIWSQRVTPSRLPEFRPCTKANAAPAPAGIRRPDALSLSQGVSPDFDWLNHVTPERFTWPAGTNRRRLRHHPQKRSFSGPRLLIVI